MIDLGISKMALIGAVALIVVGPEKLPRVARTFGTLMGRVQRYVNEVKAEVNEAMSIEELKAMKTSVESTGRQIEREIRDAGKQVEQDIKQMSDELKDLEEFEFSADSRASKSAADVSKERQKRNLSAVAYVQPHKNWRLKRGAVPHWYKARQHVRRQIQSGAARMQRYRPRNRQAQSGKLK